MPGHRATWKLCDQVEGVPKSYIVFADSSKTVSGYRALSRVCVCVYGTLARESLLVS